jgi:hypothetical protein
MSEKILVLALAAAAFFWGMRNWQRAAQAAMVLLIFEGAIRKWVFPGSQQLVYFAKDLLLIGCYLGFWTDRKNRRSQVPISPALLLLLSLGAAWVGLEVFNPNLPNLLVGILGFKAYFLYVPLMLVLPACFQDDRELARFLVRYSLLAIPVGIIALLQFGSPSTSALNTYARPSAGDIAYVATFGSSEHVRVTGTFAFITGYTSYLLALSILLLALLGSSRWRFQSHRKLYIALALTLLGMLMSGSRAPVFILALLFPFYWYLAVLREGDTGGTVGRGVLAIGIVAGAFAVVGQEALAAFLGRASAGSDTGERILAPLMDPITVLPNVGLLGFGTGSTHQTAAAVAPSIIPYSWLRGMLVEGETGKIMVELGPIGFVLIYAARLVMIGIAFGYAKSLRSRFHRSLATASFLFFVAQLLGSPVFDVTSGVYYWFFAGLMMLAVRLDGLAVRAQAAAAHAAATLPPTQAPSPPPFVPAWQTRARPRS